MSDKPHQRRIGVVRSRFRGLAIEAGVDPYLVYVLRRADRVLETLSSDERARILPELEARGLRGALLGERGYSVDRRNHIEVWRRS